MRKYRKLVVKLSKAEEQELAKLLGAGIQPVRVIQRAQSLRLLAAGQSPPQVGRSVGLTAKGVRDIGWRDVEQGREVAWYDRPWPGAPRRIGAAQKQRIIARVCADPPQGQARWTVRLIAQEAGKRKLISKIGRESVRRLLQNHDRKPWRETNGVRRRTERGIHREEGGRAGGLGETVLGSRTGRLCGREVRDVARRRPRTAPACRGQAACPSGTTNRNVVEQPLGSARWNRQRACL